MPDNDEFRVPPDLTAQPFICPNCRSSNCRGLAFVDPSWTFGIGSPSKSPWDFVFQLRVCGDCGATIPAHLAERWEGMTVEEAEEKWKRVYRDHPYNAEPAGMVLSKG